MYKVLTTLVEDWSYNPADQGNLRRRPPTLVQQLSSQVSTTHRSRAWLLPFAPLSGIELLRAANPPKGKGCSEHSLALCRRHFLFLLLLCWTIGPCFLPDRRIALHLGSILTEGNASKSPTIAVDTYSGSNLVRKADLPPDWTGYVVRGAPVPQLAAESSNPLKLTAMMQLAVRLRNKTFRIPLVVAHQLAVLILIGTAIIDAQVRCIDIYTQRLELYQGSSVLIVDGKGESSP